MATKVLFGPDQFEGLRVKMLALGFQPIPRKEFIFDRERLGLIPPDKYLMEKAYPQTGFAFYANGHRVKVWTTYEEITGKPRPQALGWVMITRRDKVPYFAHPLRRTENFFDKLIAFARACQERVLARPICPECKRGMEIVCGLSFGSRYWKCTHSSHDGHGPTANFDSGLSDESKKFLKTDRKWRSDYRMLVNFYKAVLGVAGGKKYTPARISRKRWKERNPQNRE